ncbi:MAG: biotin-dependent carboxyltransferase family protein [Deltaproteobacteria bacterium]|nr:MAG: biotin-dependent carboxyltransferase family protein [Deltaproteobacteria bacterium]
MDAFSVLTPGAFTTVQDRGRYGFQQMGIPVSGVLDAFAFRAANMLVGNPETSAVLEITVMGPRLEILNKADVAITGAEMGMTLNDQPMEGWKSISANSGDILDIHQVKSGCRAYLAVSGGIDVPVVLGSRSTYVGGKLGGYLGRPLKAGDVIQSVEAKPLSATRKFPSDLIPKHPPEILIRAIPGPQDDFFQDGLETLFQSDFMVSAKADRMGYRLQGPNIKLREGMPKSIISEPTMPGGVQIPADEQPIILLVEQTVGGYTKIVTVISTDLPKVAQATPGDTIRFEKVTLETAHSLYRERQKLLRDLEERLFHQ